MRQKREIVTGIYRITNVITGCVYVGSSNYLYERMQSYREPKLKRATKDIKESILTHGIGNHEIVIMCVFDSDISLKELHTYEDAFILLYVNRLGEEKVLNSHCNDRKKWCRKHGNLKKINQYTKDNILVKTWDSISDIQRELSYKQPNISNCCLGKHRTAYGFIWSFV